MCKVGKEKKSCTRKKDNLAQAMGENKNQTVIPFPSPPLPHYFSDGPSQKIAVPSFNQALSSVFSIPCRKKKK